MPFPSAALVPCGGEMYSHIFENDATGLARDHYWSITMRFGAIEYAGESWDCSIATEWIVFNVSDWKNLDGRTLSIRPSDDDVEASFYQGLHHPGSSPKFSLERTAQNQFLVEMEMVVDFEGDSDTDDDPELKITAKTEIEYSGLVIVPGTLSPEPSTPELARSVADEYIDSSAYHAPVRDRHRFVLAPKW